MTDVCTCLDVLGEDPNCKLHGGPLRLAVFETFGARCDQFDPECETCQAWSELDRIEALTAALPHMGGVSLMDRWLAGEFENGADAEAQDKADAMSNGEHVDASLIIEAWLTALPPSALASHEPTSEAQRGVEDAEKPEEIVTMI